MKKSIETVIWGLKIVLGSAIFALGFDLFLLPNDLNAGGISGLAMVLIHILGFGSVGLVTALMNLPLFILGGVKIGKKLAWQPAPSSWICLQCCLLWKRIRFWLPFTEVSCAVLDLASSLWLGHPPVALISLSGF